MGPFNNRETAYIRAIAGKSSHKTFVVSNDTRRIVSVPSSGNKRPQNLDTTNKGFTSFCWFLNHITSGLDARLANYSNKLTDLTPQYVHYGVGDQHELKLLKCEIDEGATGENIGGTHIHGSTGAEADIDHYHNSAVAVTTTLKRIGHQAFLESTHLQFRFTMPALVPQGTESNHSASMHTPHYEWRFIIFRNKRPTYRDIDDQNSVSQIRDGVSLANWGYDLFMGQAGRPRGFIGWRTHDKFDMDLQLDIQNGVDTAGDGHNGIYAGKYWNGSAWTDGGVADLAPPGEDLFTPDDYLTMRLNRNDYVIHTDERFFLGQQFGKSHYEKSVHFDWKDLIDTPNSDLTSSPTLDGKNYEWQFLILGSSNGPDAAELDCSVRATTSLTSGQ